MTAILAKKLDQQKAFRPMFLADWRDALFIHYRVDADLLQPHIPLPLDRFQGHACVSLVAFTQYRLRPAIHSRVGEFLSLPLARHPFLNLRTYVRRDDEPGIYFLSEWIPNVLAVFLGPKLYGLPYRLGRLDYHTEPGHATRHVAYQDRRFSCSARWPENAQFGTCQPKSETEFLMERYTAFTFHRGILRRFRIAHDPWTQTRADVITERQDLVAPIPVLRPFAAQFSPGLKDVKISRPEKIGRV